MFPQKMTNKWSVEEAQSATGMGVAICRAIVGEHGGRIEARNRGTGGSESSKVPHMPEGLQPPDQAPPAAGSLE